MTGRAEATGRGSAAVHYRRMGWLILMGVLHAHLLWCGDILYFLFFLTGVSWKIGGMILLGMALFKWGVLSAARSTAFYLAMPLLGAGVGLPLIAWRVHQNDLHGWDVGYSFFQGGRFNSLGSVPVSLAWVALVMLACRAPRLRLVLRPLESAGRMALTNDLLQTLICTSIFCGHGLGPFGTLSRVEQLAVVLGVWAFALILSPLWLRSFRYGPVEWLWRSLTYGSLQPLRSRA